MLRRQVVVAVRAALTVGATAQAPQGGRGGGRGGAGQAFEKIRQLADRYGVTGGGAKSLIRVTAGALMAVNATKL